MCAYFFQYQRHNVYVCLFVFLLFYFIFLLLFCLIFILFINFVFQSVYFVATNTYIYDST